MRHVFRVMFCVCTYSVSRRILVALFSLLNAVPVAVNNFQMQKYSTAFACTSDVKYIRYHGIAVTRMSNTYSRWHCHGSSSDLCFSLPRWNSVWSLTIVLTHFIVGFLIILCGTNITFQYSYTGYRVRRACI